MNKERRQRERDKFADEDDGGATGWGLGGAIIVTILFLGIPLWRLLEWSASLL